MALLDVEGLEVSFADRAGEKRAVDGLSFSVDPGQTLAIVGESGCGKSVTAMAMLQLVPQPPARIGGVARFGGKDLLSCSPREIRAIRGNEISMIFQEPMTSLNPVLSVGRQISETLRLHRGMEKWLARQQAVNLLSTVGIPEPERRVGDYPHQMSGGMRQRVMIAMALACSPKLLIADEPTTALDVTIQAQIIDLMRDLRTRLGAAIMLITHDLGVVADLADKVVVMYAGRKVEEASLRAIFTSPRHPYTKGLLGAIPKLGRSRGAGITRLAEIPGRVPILRGPSVGCVFASRCARADALCRTIEPKLTSFGPQHIAACHHAREELAIA